MKSAHILNNGVTMPSVGLGVFQGGHEDTVLAVRSAIETGYRLIDTAAAYNNEAAVGEGIRQSEIAPSELFVTSKLYMYDWGYDGAMRGFERTMKLLGLETLDLFLLHWPVPMMFKETIAAWKALEELYAQGRIRAIGVCNFNPNHLDELSQHSNIVPAVNQIELHPFFAQPMLREANRKRGIVTEAWSPIGGVARYGDDAGNSQRDPLKNTVITEIGLKYGKSPAQIALRWHIEHDVVAIPKSTNPDRIAENFDIFDFSLTPEEIAALDALDTGKRSGPDPETFLDDSRTAPE